jgi:hypothetical protein
MRKLWPILSVINILILFGCATFKPSPIDEALYRNRALAKSDGEVQVAADVLGVEETKKVFGFDLYKKGIQPIWIEIENNTEVRLWFPLVSVDPNYFAPLEVAYLHHFSFSKNTNRHMDEYFYDQAMGPYVSPGKVRSGFVFTNLDLGTKGFNVDLIGEDHEIRRFLFFISVPGFRVSHQDVELKELYSKDELVSIDNEKDLKTAIEGLPCCTTNQDRTKQGDPLNLVIISSGKALHHALIRSGWDETASAKAYSESKEKILTTFEKQSQYGPVTLQYVYGRPQDGAFRKSRETADERNHLRLWLSPIRYKGKPVWVGQINRDIKVRFLPNTFQIEPFVDEARTYMLQNLWYSQGLAKFGYLKGVGAASMSEPRKNMDGHSYFTDGYRLVMWLTSKSISFSEVEALQWGAQPTTLIDY